MSHTNEEKISGDKNRALWHTQNDVKGVADEIVKSDF